MIDRMGTKGKIPRLQRYTSAGASLLHSSSSPLSQPASLTSCQFFSFKYIHSKSWTTVSWVLCFKMPSPSTFFFFWMCPWHMEVPRSGIKPMPQKPPKPLQDNAGSLTRRSTRELPFSQAYYWRRGSARGGQRKVLFLFCVCSWFAHGCFSEQIGAILMTASDTYVDINSCLSSNFLHLWEDFILTLKLRFIVLG